MRNYKITTIYLGKKGAGNVYSFEMVKNLLENNVQIYCILSSYIENKNDWDNLLLKNPNTLSIDYIKTFNNFLRLIITLLLGFIKFRKVRKKIERFTPDCIYIPMISVLTCFLVRKSKFPVVTTIHDINTHLGEENQIIKYLFDKTIESSNKFIVLSKRFIESVAQKYKVSKSDIYFIPHANFSFYVPNGYKPNFSKLNYKILFFGRIHKYKGLEVLLKAMEIVSSKRKDIKLVIAGNGVISNSEKILLDKLNNNIEANIKWISDCEVHKYFENIDLTVIPYIEASQSGVIALSYSFGKTVIASNIGGLPEQIINNCGIIVEPGDFRELAKTILDLYDNPQKLSEMNINAFNVSNTVLSWNYSANEIIKILNETIKK